MSNSKSKIDELVELIKKRISEKYYLSGQRLPAEREIGEELGYSRTTVHSALLRLQNENIIDIIPRSGSYIRKNSVKSIIGPKIFSENDYKSTGSYTHDLNEIGIEVNFIEPSSIIYPDKNIQEMLKIDKETEVLRRYRIQSIEKTPYRVIDGYYLASLFGEIVGKDKYHISVLNWLYENKGIYAKEGHERLNIRMPSENEAKLLKISKTQPVVDMDKWLWSNKGVLIQYTKIIFNASLHEYNYKYELEISSK
jgi:DNA-binding GntR family transcriptional regulator